MRHFLNSLRIPPVITASPIRRPLQYGQPISEESEDCLKRTRIRAPVRRSSDFSYTLENSMRVLIVEDEKRVADLLKTGLEEDQYSVIVAHDGRDGLELALQGVCDVLVLDVMLPGLTGFEIARRLREKGNRTPILMLTARDAVTDVVKGLDLGA